jgi:alpha-D-ribose 1-methylphosphonate 5-triphosphate diphosphatase PhnM
MSALLLRGGQVLLEDGLRAIDLGAGPDGLELDPHGPARAFDARGLLVLPGIVDLHGDAFERQLQPPAPASASCPDWRWPTRSRSCWAAASPPPITA